MKLDLLAIAAHPDDVELTCGGTLLKAAEQGYKTGILDLTAGEMGTRGTPETRLKEAAKAGQDFARRAPRKSSAARLECGSHKRNEAGSGAAHSRAATPYRDSSLLGRQASGPLQRRKLGYEGCFLAGLKQLPISGEAFRPFKILYSTVYFREVRPTFVVDISRQYERRYRAILAYHSQFSPKTKDKKSKVDIPLDRLHHEVNLIARYYGQMAGVEYAEPFLVKEVMQVDDVLKLPVRSI